jgi:hypothetical protein
MKGVTILYDEANKRRLLQIDLSEVDRENEAIEDLFDLIIAETPEEGGSISLEEMKRLLKVDGKL